MAAIYFTNVPREDSYCQIAWLFAAFCDFGSTWQIESLLGTLLVGGLEHDFCFSHHIGNVIIPTDEVHHFSEVESIPPTRHPLWLWIATTRPPFRTPKHFHKKSDNRFPTKHGSLDTKQHLYLFSWLYPKTACWFPFNKNWIHVRGYRFFTTRPTGQRLQVSKTILIWLNHHCFIDEITMCVKTET